ncbi:MAG: PrsW family intramembrane metalloprotease [Chloroflexia bacterium]
MLLLSVLAALVSTIVYLLLLWWLDKYEKEPWGLFLAAFGYGSIPAIALAVLLEVAASVPLSLMLGAGGEAIGRVVVAPVVEEGVKGLVLLLIFFLWRGEFDDLLDGILYGAAVGFGFGMTENLLYFFQTHGEPSVVLLRTLPFGLNHALFTSCTGAALGLARQSTSRTRWLLLFPLGLLAAISLHGFHNLSVGWGCPGILAALASDWGGIATILVAAMLSWVQERRWIRQELQEEVAAGLLAETEMRTLQFVSQRVGARLWIWRKHGWRAFRLLGQFFQAATELAFRKHDLRRGTGKKGTSEEVQRLRRRVLELRGTLLEILEGP